MKKIYFLLFGMSASVALLAQSVYINEIHYDNISTDVNESIEIMGTANADLSNYSIVLYNGSNNETYGNKDL